MILHRCHQIVHHPDGDRQCQRRRVVGDYCWQHRREAELAVSVPLPERSGRGGARPGAGRPPLGLELRRVTVTLPVALVERLHALGCGNVSRGIRVLADAHPDPRRHA